MGGRGMRLTMSIDDGPNWIIDTGDERSRFDLSDLEMLLDEILPGTYSRLKYEVIREFFVTPRR